MKHFLAVITITIVTSTMAAAADEEDTRNPLDKYRGNSVYVLTLCQATFFLAQQKAKLDQQQDEQSDYSACIEKGKSTTKDNLDKALRTVKKPKAKEALKSYHVAFITELEGIRPGINELTIDYERRQQALQDKANEAWTRFEVER